MEKIFFQRVKMKDGSTLNLSMIPSGSGQFSSRKWFGLLPYHSYCVYVNIPPYKKVINPQQVESITINGKEIKIQ